MKAEATNNTANNAAGYTAQELHELQDNLQAVRDEFFTFTKSKHAPAFIDLAFLAASHTDGKKRDELHEALNAFFEVFATHIELDAWCMETICKAENVLQAYAETATK